MLVIIDAHSKCPEVVIMKSTATDGTIEKLEIFTGFGEPGQIHGLLHKSLRIISM